MSTYLYLCREAAARGRQKMPQNTTRPAHFPSPLRDQLTLAAPSPIYASFKTDEARFHDALVRAEQKWKDGSIRRSGEQNSRYYTKKTIGALSAT